MLVSLITVALVLLPLAQTTATVLEETAQDHSQRQLASTIEELRQVANDFPECGSRRSFGFADSRRFSFDFSDNVRKYTTGLPRVQVDPPFYYSSSYLRYHLWARREFRYTAENNASFDTVGEPLRVVLAFVENYSPNCAKGKRIFSATVNGKPFFTDLDVYDTVGCNTLLVIAKDIESDGSGKIDIEFKSTVQNPMVSLVEIISRTGCNDPCPCWTPEAVAENAVSLVYVRGSRAGSQSLKAFSGKEELEISKALTKTGEMQYYCDTRYGTQVKLVLSAEQAGACRAILRPAVDEYYERMIGVLTQNPLSEYCNCWGIRNSASEDERTSCSPTSWINYGRNFYSSADEDVSPFLSHLLLFIHNNK